MLMQEIKPIVTKQREFEYQDKPRFFIILWNFRINKILMPGTK